MIHFIYSSLSSPLYHQSSDTDVMISSFTAVNAPAALRPTPPPDSAAPRPTPSPDGASATREDAGAELSGAEASATRPRRALRSGTSKQSMTPFSHSAIPYLGKDRPRTMQAAAEAVKRYA